MENMSRELIPCRHRHHHYHRHLHRHHPHHRRRYDFVNHEKFRYLTITLRLPTFPSGETPRFRRSISSQRLFFPFLSVLARSRYNYNDDDHD